MNALFFQQLRLAMDLVTADHRLWLSNIQMNLSKAAEVKKVTESFMGKMAEAGLVSHFEVSLSLHAELVHFKNAPKSPQPNSPNAIAFDRVSKVLDTFLKEQDLLNETDPDNSWHRYHERQLVHAIARSFKFSGLIKDYSLAGEKVGVEPQDPQAFMDDKQRARYRATQIDDSPSP